jgi:hypothetical protein
MSDYQEKYSNGGVDHQTIANEIMSILGRLDALEGKLEALTPWDEQGRRVSAIYPGETCKGAVPAPELKINDRHIEMRTVDELVAGGAMWAGVYSDEEIVAEIHRRIFQARQEGYDERRCSESAKPAPEPPGGGLSTLWSRHALSGNYTVHPDGSTSTDCVMRWEHKPATVSEVRAEAVRLGLLDDTKTVGVTPEEQIRLNKSHKRAEVAEALLVALLDDNGIDDYDLGESQIQDLLDYVEKDDQSQAEHADIWFGMLKRMAAVLEAAAKGEK